LAILSCCMFCLQACSTIPTTPESIRGRYELRSGPMYYAGEWIDLGNGTFEAGIFTDVLNDERLKHYPIRGGYTLDGCLITFQSRFVSKPRRILVRRGGRFTMWTPSDYEEFLRTRHTADSVLYQRKSK